MCFYPYCPGKDIEVTYVNESIRLNLAGSSEISVLIIIKNNTYSQDLRQLYLLYPNSFYDKWDKHVQEFVRSSHFANHSQEFRNPMSPKHYPYTKDTRRGLVVQGDEIEITDH